MSCYVFHSLRTEPMIKIRSTECHYLHVVASSNLTTSLPLLSWLSLILYCIMHAAFEYFVVHATLMMLNEHKENESHVRIVSLLLFSRRCTLRIVNLSRCLTKECCKSVTGTIWRFPSSQQMVPARLIITVFSIVLSLTTMCGHYQSTVLVILLLLLLPLQFSTLQQAFDTFFLVLSLHAFQSSDVLFKTS